MRLFVKHVIVALLLLSGVSKVISEQTLAFPAATLASAQTKQPSAQDFSLPDLNGRTIKLSDWKGKVILLDFWATWCEPCVADIPILNRLHDKYGSGGLKVVGVAMQSGWAQDIKPYVAKYNMKLTVLVGSDDVVDRYQVIGLPTTFLIGRDGRVHKKYLGTLPGKEGEKAADIEREIQKLLALP